MAVDHGAQVVLAAGRGQLGDVGHGELAGAPERGVAVLPEPGPLVLIGALRDPQESGDLSEGQA